MLKSYEDGMTRGEDGLHHQSDFVLNHSTGAESLSGGTMTGKFVPVSLSDTSPKDETMLHPNEGDPNE